MATLSTPTSRRWNQTRSFQKRPISIPAKAKYSTDVAIVGAGIAGIAAAFYIRHRSNKSVVLIDSRQPMSYTSAQSGDNYRNWWPHPTMTAFTNDSIDELDRLNRESDNFFHMSRGGYALATRRTDVADLVHGIPGGIDVDVVDGSADIKKTFPSLDVSINSLIHIKRGGDISGQQLGQYMLQQIKGELFSRLQGEVVDIGGDGLHRLDIRSSRETNTVDAEVVINAAGPFVGRVAEMLNKSLPVKNIYQQKIAFEDTCGAVPRDMPFSIDLDEKNLGWSDEERALLAEDPDLAWLTERMPGGTHCRPEGGTNGRWVKLGWAYNTKLSEPLDDMANEPAIDPQFPEIVIRGAAQFLPAMRAYIDEPPLRISHYGGYYTMTEENWPLIGPLNNDGAFVIGALSGFGSMSACAAGKLCACYVLGSALPDYAADLSLSRLENASLLAELRASSNKGLL